METSKPGFPVRHAVSRKQILPNRLAYLLTVVALAATCTVHGQTTYEAMLDYRPRPLGYVHGTGGWTFQPQKKLSVTSLGCMAEFIDGGISGGQVTVGLWASDGSLLASRTVSTNSELVNKTRYEPISAVLLMPAQTYYLGAYSGTTFVYGADATSVSMSPQVQLGVFAIGTNGTFEFPSKLGSSPNPSAYVAPNFQFTVVQPALWLSISFTNRSAVLNVTGSNSTKAMVEWVTNISNWTPANILTTNTVPYSYIDTDSSNSATRFYRAVDIP